MTAFVKKNLVKWYCLFLLQAVVYLYFITSVHRSQTHYVFLIFIFLFAGYAYTLNKYKSFYFRYIIAFAIIFRIVMLFGLPWLSDDFYRFLWDGFLSYQGLNPYLHIPQELLATGFQAPFSIDLMNSPSYYTVYPPFGQFTFFIANFLGKGDVFYTTLCMKLMMLFAELGTLYFLNVLLKKRNKQRYLLVYALNPLVIVEFVGNLHAEGFMIFFLVLAIWLIEKQKLFFSSVAFALSICSKLLPILFLPFLLWLLGWKKAFFYIVSVICLVALGFLPFWDYQLFPSMAKSLALYFNHLEFNASFYYLFKWMHWHLFEGALYVLKALFVIVFFLIWYRRRQAGIETFLVSSFFVFTLYLFSSQSIHPWYICMPLFLSVFTSYRFPIVWTFLSVFTYITYRTEAMQQQMWVVCLEYVILFGMIVWEVSKRKIKNESLAYEEG